MREFLLLGGSHLNSLISLISLLTQPDGGQYLPPGWALKIVTCSDLDFVGGMNLTPAGEIDCQRQAALSQSCQSAYGQPIIPLDPERIIGLSLGSWHHAADDPIWLSHYPADLPSGPGSPISLHEVMERIQPEVITRVRVMAMLRGAGHRFFLIPAPPPSFFHEGAVAGAPPGTVLYIHNLCAALFRTAMAELNLTWADCSGRDLDPNGFLRPELSLSFNNSHARGRDYGRLLWPAVLERINELARQD